MKVKFKKLSELAFQPTKAHESDAGFDLYATRMHTDDDGAIVYHTDLALEIPDGFVGLLFSRSSISKKDMIQSNCVGVIDSGYRGEVMIKFKPIANIKGSCNPSNVYNIKDRICQLIIMPYPEIKYVEVKELSDSDRGNGGYGSTGK